MTFQPCHPPLTPTVFQPGLPLCLLEPMQVNMFPRIDKAVKHNHDVIAQYRFWYHCQRLRHPVAYNINSVLKACPKVGCIYFIPYPCSAPVFTLQCPAQTLKPLSQNIPLLI